MDIPGIRRTDRASSCRAYEAGTRPGCHPEDQTVVADYIGIVTPVKIPEVEERNVRVEKLQHYPQNNIKDRYFKTIIKAKYNIIMNIPLNVE